MTKQKAEKKLKDLGKILDIAIKDGNKDKINSVITDIKYLKTIKNSETNFMENTEPKIEKTAYPKATDFVKELKRVALKLLLKTRHKADKCQEDNDLLTKIKAYLGE
jgi:hypothetical protein